MKKEQLLQQVKKLEQHINQQQTTLDVLGATTKAIISAKTFEEALQYTLDIICNATGWEIGHAYALDLYGRNEMVSMPIWHVKNKSRHQSFLEATEKITRFGVGMGLPGQVLQTNRPEWLINIQNDADSPRKKLCVDMAVKGAFAFPVIEKGKTVAVLEFFSEQEMVVDNDLFTMMQHIGRHVGSILRKKHLEKSLQQQKFALDQAALVLQTDTSGKILYANQAFCKLSQYSAKELLGKKCNLFNSGCHAKAIFTELWETITKGEVWHGELRNRAKDGSFYWLSITIVPLLNEKGEPYQFLAINKNITTRKYAEEKIKYLAYYDTLTGLPNRILFKEHLEFIIKNCDRSKERFAILFLDLDNFKRINDTFGHDGGDYFLKEVAKKLITCLRKSDCIGRLENEESIQRVSRLGGDEFTVLLTGSPSAENIAKIAKRIIKALTTPFKIQNREVLATISIGIAAYPEDGRNLQTLLKNADAAMYYVKQEGKNDYQFYSQSMNATTAKKLQLENDLRLALEQEAIQLYYQPKLNLKSGEVTGHEALARWHHPKLGIVPPEEFISLAEETNLIIPIDEHILRTACQQNYKWHQQGYSNLCIAVNISPRHFKKPLLNVIKRILAETKLPPQFLELELTEGAIMSGDKETIEKLRSLKDLGIKISIDDFGTGYSSLSYLSQFPIDTIKIDRSFILNLTNHARDMTITKAILSLAHSLNLSVIAEGVETEEQLSFLERKGCDEIQGFLLSKPLAAAQIARLMKKQYINKYPQPYSLKKRQ